MLKKYIKRTTCNPKGELNAVDVFARSFSTQENGALAISQSTCLFSNTFHFHERELTWRFFFFPFFKMLSRQKL